MSQSHGQLTEAGDADGPDQATAHPSSDDMERRFRGVQIANIQKFTPLMMAGNVINAGLYVLVADQAGMLAFAGPWFALIVLYSVCAIRSWRLSRHRDPAMGASRHAVRLAVVSAFLLGLAWGVAALVLYPAANAQGQTITAVITGGMIYGGGFALSAIPATLNAYLAPLVLSGILALGLRFQPIDLLLGIPLVVFAIIIQRAGAGHGRMLRANFEDRERIAEQSNVIRLLLRDFERGTSDWLWQIDAQGRLQRGVERTAQAIDMPVEELRTCDFRTLTDRCFERPDCDAAIVRQHLAAGTPFRDLEVFFPNPKEPRWLRLSGHPLVNGSGETTGFRGVASDISTEKAAKQRIAYLASHDPLTGLLNRSSFSETLGDAFEALHAAGGSICLLYLDLDGFKEVNDRRGHLAGDRLLVDVAHRIKEATGGQGCVARVGGDEFAVLVRDLEIEMAQSLGSRLIHAIGQPLDLDGDMLRIGVCIGIAFAGPDADSPEKLISAADLALYRAKAGSKNTSRVFDAEMRARAQKRRQMQQCLHYAIERNELELHYQPIVAASSERLCGFEALLRWRHPVYGLVPPDDFIALAEIGGTIHEIGSWVAREACRAAARWPAHLFVTINLSPEQFQSANLIAEIDNAIRTSAIDPARLEVELAEGVLIDDALAVARRLRALKDLGVSVALDDFGTGYSSFGYLTTFDFDRLKIDRSLVHRCDADARARNVLEAIMVMSRALGLQTTAEGVETARHATVLRTLGCNLLQGNHFARPLHPDATRALLSAEILADAAG